MPQVNVEVPIVFGGEALSLPEHLLEIFRKIRDERDMLEPKIQAAVAGIEKMHRKPEQVTVTFVPVFAAFMRADILMNEDEERDKETQDEAAQAVTEVLVEYYGKKYTCDRVTTLVCPFDNINQGAFTWRRHQPV